MRRTGQAAAPEFPLTPERPNDSYPGNEIHLPVMFAIYARRENWLALSACTHG